MALIDYKATTTRASDFTPLAELAEDIDYLDHTIPLGRTNFPTVDALKVGMACLCEDEFMQLTGIVAEGVTVKRGTADTVPARHPANALIWFFDNTLVGADGVERSAGETVSVKYSPYTIGGGSFPISASEIDTVVFNHRFFRPYPPGQMKVRGQRWWIEQMLSADDPAMTLTWTHRSRIIQADQLVDHDVTNIGPEPGTTYTARIFDANGNLRRTVTGLMATIRNKYGALIPPSWTYSWSQAMVDLGFENPAEEGQIVSGHIDFCSTRQGFDSWQDYRIDFKIDTQGKFVKVAQLAALTAQQPLPIADPGTPPQEAVFDGQIAQLTAQAPGPDVIDGDVIGGDGMYVAQLAQPTGSETNFYTPMNRNLFEAPYGFLAERDGGGDAHKLITVVARPSDRLTDSHDIHTRYDWPVGSGVALNYDMVAEPLFTPWATLLVKLSYLDNSMQYDKTSFVDGVSLSGVQPGMVALVDAEFIRIDAVNAEGAMISRGVYDTVPALHKPGARIWFFEVEHGNDPTNYPERVANGVLGGAVQVKMRPAVYGPPLDLKDVPTDRLEFKQRVQRPYPPGQVLVNNNRWYLGAQIDAAHPAHITWVHRNRITQDAQVIDHLAPDQGAEYLQKYRLRMSVMVKPQIGPSYEVVIREVTVEGYEFDYTWDMAKQDGYRAGSLLGVCGRVTVGLTLFAEREGFLSWQGYVIPLLLPSYACPPGQPPGGGQLPPTTGGGNGDVGEDTPGGQTPGDNTGDGPGDPIDNGGGGDDGNGPPEPPEVPPEWPDPVEPIPEDPEDPNPALAAHWDRNWDRHWDAYTKDNIGG